MFIGFLPHEFVRPIECLMIAYRCTKPKHAAHFRTTEVTRIKTVVVDNYILHVSLCLLMIRLHKKRKTTKSATRTISTNSGSTEYQVFLRSVTNINEPSNELLKATTGDEMAWRGEVWCRYHLYRREGSGRKTQNRHFSNISRTEDALCQIFMNSVQAHSSYNHLAGTPTF